jgi:hypothetical protein
MAFLQVCPLILLFGKLLLGHLFPFSKSVSNCFYLVDFFREPVNILIKLLAVFRLLISKVPVIVNKVLISL